MKKILYTLICLVALSGCGNINNTPKKQVEAFFNRYQMLDQEVLKDLDSVIKEEIQFNSDNRDEYEKLIKNQYQNLMYEIKDETINGDEATVTAEITVTDYTKIIRESLEYKNTNPKEFVDEYGNYSASKYSSYLINKLKSAKEKVKYTVNIDLTKADGKWKINEIDQDTEDKILGIYEY